MLWYNFFVSEFWCAWSSQSRSIFQDSYGKRRRALLFSFCRSSKMSVDRVSHWLKSNDPCLRSQTEWWVVHVFVYKDSPQSELFCSVVVRSLGQRWYTHAVSWGTADLMRPIRESTSEKHLSIYICLPLAMQTWLHGPRVRWKPCLL